MASLRSCLALALVVASASAFVPLPAAKTLLPRSGFKSTMAPSTPATVAPHAPSSTSLVLASTLSPDAEPSQMDERLFNFNKVVIDTVYDIICVLYANNN